MTDQPSQAALQEAVRRLNEAAKEACGISDYYVADNCVAVLVARLIEKHEPETLVDPVIEARKVKAREIAANRLPGLSILAGKHDDCAAVETALAALTFADWRPAHD